MTIYPRQWTPVGVCALILSLTACHNNGEQADMIQADEPVPGTQTQNNSNMKAPLNDKSMDEQISNAIADLAKRTDVSEDTITIHSASVVTWSSGAMGCPKPGMSYTQAIVPGVRLLLEANGSIHYYHGRTGADLFYCPVERAKAPAYGPGEEVM